MDGTPCRTCREDCGDACLALRRAQERARLAVLAHGGAGLVTVGRSPHWLSTEDVW